jgi:predicted HicB family RNase H-like nuclease
MGRPRVYDEPRVTTALRLSPAMREELKRRAGDLGVSVNQLVVSTLTEFLARPRRPSRRRL